MPIAKNKMPEYMRQYWKKNPDKYEDHKRKLREKSRSLKVQIIKLLGGRCVNPFNLKHGDFLNDIRCLQIDHIQGGGSKVRRKTHNLPTYYSRILKEIQNGSKDYQLLCANCNWLKYRLKNRKV